MKLAIDPSINNVGFSTLKDGEYNWGYISVPPKVQELDGRCAYICRHLPPSESVTHLIIEYPIFMQCDRGQIAAQKGYTIMLGYVCGYLSKHFENASLFLYTPTDWKGQLPKKAVQTRFLRLFGDEYKHVVDHAYEACMLLVYHETGSLI